jgi:hypothetical protein
MVNNLWLVGLGLDASARSDKVEAVCQGETVWIALFVLLGLGRVQVRSSLVGRD